MKKIIWAILGMAFIATLAFWTGCKKDGDSDWSDDDQAAYNKVINLQDEVGAKLDDWLTSMDSLEAINLAQQEFANDPAVTAATISIQGITVQYESGIRGGILMSGKRMDNKKSLATMPDIKNTKTVNNLNSIVNKRKMILLDAAYTEFSYFTDQVYSISSSNLARVDISTNHFHKNSEVSLDQLTQLSGYGIIDLQSHGIAWPKENNITDVYFLTGEEVNVNTTRKYWDDMKLGKIPIVLLFTSKSTRKTKYYISADFIKKHNDFSQDTVLIYGGFCYSFLGDWPDIVDGLGDGAYLGFDWSVEAFHCANWDVNMIALMSDTTEDVPLNLEGWMKDSGVEKSYWDAADSRTVDIHYAGDGNLKLWDDVSVRLIPLSSDGAPVSVPGEAGEPYPFRCEVVTSVSELEFMWDVGDGSAPVSASNEVNITWSEDGNYVLKVDVNDKSNGNSIGTAMVNVVIGSTVDVLEFVTSCNGTRIYFGSGGTSPITIWDEPSFYGTPWGAVSTYGYISWSGSSFSGTITSGDGTYSNTHSISGNIGNNGQIVNLVAEQEGFKVYGASTKHYFYYKMTVNNAPLYRFDPPLNGFPGQAYYGDESGQNAQNYVTDFEGRLWTDDGTYSTVTGIDWDIVESLIITFNKENSVN